MAEEVREIAPEDVEYLNYDKMAYITLKDGTVVSIKADQIQQLQQPAQRLCQYHELQQNQQQQQQEDYIVRNIPYERAVPQPMPQMQIKPLFAPRQPDSVGFQAPQPMQIPVRQPEPIEEPKPIIQNTFCPIHQCGALERQTKTKIFRSSRYTPIVAPQPQTQPQLQPAFQMTPPPSQPVQQEIQTQSIQPEADPRASSLSRSKLDPNGIVKENNNYLMYSFKAGVPPQEPPQPQPQPPVKEPQPLITLPRPSVTDQKRRGPCITYISEHRPMFKKYTAINPQEMRRIIDEAEQIKNAKTYEQGYKEGYDEACKMCQKPYNFDNHLYYQSSRLSKVGKP